MNSEAAAPAPSWVSIWRGENPIVFYLERRKSFLSGEEKVRLFSIWRGENPIVFYLERRKSDSFLSGEEKVRFFSIWRLENPILCYLETRKSDSFLSGDQKTRYFSIWRVKNPISITRNGVFTPRYRQVSDKPSRIRCRELLK